MALPQFGSLTTFDTLASTEQSIAQFGEDNAWDGIASMLDSYNAQVTAITTPLMEKTTSRLRRYGTAAQMEMQRMDEMGTPNAQKVSAGVPVGFPLEDYGIALQWSQLFMKQKTVKQLAAQVSAATTADLRRIIRNVKIALFMGLNYNFTDYLVDHVEIIPLPIKSLLNADGAPIPPGPNGEVFNGSTHTHYLANAGLTNGFAGACLQTVLEHYNDGQAVIWISRNDESAFRLLPDFIKMTYDTVIKATNVEYAPGSLNPTKLYNRMIGYFQGAEVWTKPWMIPGYMFSYMEGQPQPLVMRIRGVDVNGGVAVDGAGDFGISYEDEVHPLRAKAFEREYGISVWNRTNGSIGYFTGGGSVYVQPIIA